MKNPFRFALFFIVGIAVAKTGFTQNINFQFRDTAALVNTFIDIPVRATNTFTGLGVISYSLQFSYNATYISSQGVVTTGTISAALGTPTVNTSVPGIITIAGAGTTALTGSGNFILLRFKILQAGGTGIANTGPANNFLNEESPTLTFQNACTLTGIALPVIAVNPTTALLLKGETQQFTASGGTGPYTWNSSNPGIASIASTGLLTATQAGFTVVKATDINSNFGETNNIEVRGYRLSIPDTTGVYNSYFNMPVRVTSLTGLNVLSGSFSITYPQAALSEIEIVTAGTLLAAVPAPTLNLNTPGVIQISFSNTTALSGAGVLFFIRCKLSNISGSYASFNFQDALLNEDLLAITKNGYVNYPAPPGISLSPNSGQLVYGDSLLLTVNGSNVTPPFTWVISDNSLASISANRFLSVKKSGQITISVTDANSAVTNSGIFQLYDTYLKISDTVATAGEQIEIPVFIKALPPGQSIFAMQGRVYTSNPSLFSISDIVIAGTAASTFSVSTTLGINYIEFAIAGVTGITGNSVLFKVRGTMSATATVGAGSSLSFQNLLLNEGEPLPLIQTGNITTIAATSVYTFTGNGNWDVASNWLNNLIPPANLPAPKEIIIDPVSNGECVLNILQHLAIGSKITINAGKKLRILGDLNIN